MILCINGDRECTDMSVLEKAIAHFKIDIDSIAEIVSGGARGADKLGEKFAKRNKIPIKVFEADWDDIDSPGAVIKYNKFGKPYNAKAGFTRNADMAAYSDQLLCLQPNGETNGSQGCVKDFKNLDKTVYVFPENKEKKYKF